MCQKQLGNFIDMQNFNIVQQTSTSTRPTHTSTCQHTAAAAPITLPSWSCTAKDCNSEELQRKNYVMIEQPKSHQLSQGNEASSIQQQIQRAVCTFCTEVLQLHQPARPHQPCQMLLATTHCPGLASLMKVVKDFFFFWFSNAPLAFRHVKKNSTN